MCTISAIIWLIRAKMKTEQGNLTTLISCTKARPNLTCTFSVIFCTGRMSLLYPLNKSRTSLSSSSEHRPTSKTINAINGTISTRRRNLESREINRAN